MSDWWNGVKDDVTPAPAGDWWKSSTPVAQPQNYSLNVADADWDNVEEPTKNKALDVINYVRNKYSYNPTITSGYRDETRNRNAGGAANSWHLYGKAVDLDLSDLTPDQVEDVKNYASNNFGEVLFHDVGSGLHLHIGNPNYNTSIGEKVASVFKTSVAEASPSGGSWWGNDSGGSNDNQGGSWWGGNSGGGNTPQPTEESPYEKLYDRGRRIVTRPAVTAIDFIENFDRPRGALAGMIQKAAGQTNDESYVAAAQRGWEERPSFTKVIEPSFSPEWKAKHPGGEKVVGTALDIIVDPLNFIAPAKIVSGAKTASKAIGLTDKVAPIAEKVVESPTGQKVIGAVSDFLGVNKPTQEAHEVYNATKGGLMGEVKDSLTEVEKIVKEQLPNADRQQVEAIMQRMVEAYPDIGQFAQAADKTAARDLVIKTLRDNVDTAKLNYDAAKEAAGKIGSLTDEERVISQILKDNNIPVSALEDAVKAARGMDEVVKPAGKVAQGVDDFIKLKKSAANLVLSGKISAEDLPKLRSIFSDEELKALMPSLKRTLKDSPALTEIEKGMQAGKGFAVNPASVLEGNVLRGIGKQTGEKLPSVAAPEYKQFKWEEIVRSGHNGELTQPQINAAKGILTPMEFETFSQKSMERSRVNQAVVESALSKGISPQDVLKFKETLTADELKQLGEKLTEQYPRYGFGMSKNSSIREMINGIKQAAAEKALKEKRLTDILARGLAADVTKQFKDVSLSVPPLKADINADLPKLFNDNMPNITGEKVLPDVRIGKKPESGVALNNITEDGRRLLADIQNVPELAEKIRTAREFEKQTSALERAKDALEKADVSPEKITDVFESALKFGYTPAQVEAMFKSSEIMRQINQLMTNEALKRALIPVEAAGEFSSGRHLRRMYAALENPEKHYENLVKAGYKELADKFWQAYSKFDGAMQAKGIKINMGTFEARQQIPKVLQDQLGRIYQATYPFAAGNKMAAEQFAKYDFLKTVAERHGSDTMKPGYKKIPMTDDKIYGQLEGKFVPDRVYKEIMFNVSKWSQEATLVERGVQRWKAAKLVNPASISRNFMSGAAMANVFGEVPFQKLLKYAKDSMTDLKAGTERYLTARNNGLFETNINKAEIDALGKRISGEKTGIVERYDQLAAKGMQYFSMPDNFWRMVVYNYHIDQGKAPIEAVRMANRAMFDYGNAPRWLDYVSRKGLVPFGKFPYFAAKETLRALYYRPAQVTKYFKPQNQTNSDDREKIMPDYLQAKTLLPIGEQTRIVNGQPQKVQGNIDLSYILPFSNDVSLGGPLFDFVQMYRTGRNSLGMDVLKPGMTNTEKVGKLSEAAANSLLPSIITPATVGKLYNGVTGRVDSKGRQYNALEGVSDVGLGIRNVPINTEELYKSKLLDYRRQYKDEQSRMFEVQRDKSLSNEQRQEKLDEHKRQMKKLAADLQDMQAAYSRIKAKGD